MKITGLSVYISVCASDNTHAIFARAAKHACRSILVYMYIYQMATVPVVAGNEYRSHVFLSFGVLSDGNGMIYS